FYFFFSSRRRHTRCLSDWSSDVCSSDLYMPGKEALLATVQQRCFMRVLEGATRAVAACAGDAEERLQAFIRHHVTYFAAHMPERSEERRVGKECRSRWAPDDERRRMRRS